jgi:hypothetical protein
MTNEMAIRMLRNYRVHEFVIYQLLECGWVVHLMKRVAITIATLNTVNQLRDIANLKESNFWGDVIGHGDIMTLSAEIKKPGVPGFLEITQKLVSAAAVFASAGINFDLVASIAKEWNL